MEQPFTLNCQSAPQMASDKAHARGRTVKGGQDCHALTGHIDMVPTLLAMAGVGSGKSGEFAGRALPGKDITPLLTSPGSADVHAAREGVLFTYSGLAANDSDLWREVDDAKAAGKEPCAGDDQEGLQAEHEKTRQFAICVRRPLQVHTLLRSRPTQPEGATPFVA
jgi:arylsulfatase A-like enzyme